MNVSTRLLITAVAVATVTLGLLPSAEAQMPGGVHSAKVVRPHVMLALDTSGSMEWRVATFADGDDRMPTCKMSTGEFERSRWLTAVEVLTGSYIGYKCQQRTRGGQRAGYFIPHIGLGDTVLQEDDGLMDIYDEEIEFGLMTMDNEPSSRTDVVGGYSYPGGGDVIAPGHTRRTYGLDSTQGIEWTKVADPSCEFFWNVGARRPPTVDGITIEDFPGAMIPHDFIPVDAVEPYYRARNAAVQQELLEVWPYWSSPIAALLDDAQYYFGNHPGLAPAVDGVGDCYADCRDRHVILITDGIPNQDGRPECLFSIEGSPPEPGVCPYPEAHEAALALFNDGVQVHVIGFSAVDDTTDVLDDDGNVIDVISEIWRIGMYGWGGAESGCPEDEEGNRECALYADDADELRAALGRIFDRIIEGSTSHTRTATVNSVISDSMGQYQIFSSMEVSVGGTWEGNLERVTYTCSQDDDGDWELERDADVFNFADEGLDEISITDHSTRRLFTVNPNNSISPLATATTLGPGGTNFITLDDTNLSHTDFDVRDENARQEVLDWMHGVEGTVRAERRLGAIYHSTPVIIGPPSMELPLTSYNVGPHISAGDTFEDGDQIGFRQLYARRPHIIYAATMDGILHAFDLHAENTSGNNPELWGFVPPMLLDLLDDQRRTQMFLLDGNITVRDVRLWKANEVGTDPDDPSLEEWATILVMGLRYGGGVRGYFALDVTAPETGASAPGSQNQADDNGPMRQPADPPYGQPFLRWQITSDTVLPASTGYAYESLRSFAGLGQTYGRPAFGTVVVEDGSDAGETGVVILPGGRRPSGEDNPAVGCGLYIVDASDGRLIRWLHPDDASCSIDEGEPLCEYTPSTSFDCQFVGTPLPLGGVPGEVTTRIFVGDSRGTLYRADLSDPDPSEWTVEPFFSLYEEDEASPQPIMEAPAAARDHRGLVTLVFGTGNPDDLQGRPVNRMASVTEMFDFGGLTDTEDPIVGGDHTCHLDWGDVTPDFEGTLFSLPTQCTTTDRVFPWVNWALNMDPSSVYSTANLDGVSGGTNSPFVVGERLMGSPVIFNETTYFTTFVPGADPDNCCMPGHGRILGIHYLGDETDDPTDTTDVLRSLEDRDLSIEVGTMDDNELSYGLAIVRRPSCVELTQEDTGEWVPRLETAGEAEYDIVAHNNSAPEDAIDADTDVPETGFLELELPAPPLQCRPDSWVSIFGI